MKRKDIVLFMTLGFLLSEEYTCTEVCKTRKSLLLPSSLQIMKQRKSKFVQHEQCIPQLAVGSRVTAIQSTDEIGLRRLPSLALRTHVDMWRKLIHRVLPAAP